MEGFKEFLGKTLDAAITEACSYYNASREKLEIEIVQDAKTGIFGIVGARKAKVRARRAALREAVESALGRGRRSAAAATDAAGEHEGGDAPAAAAAQTPPPGEERPSRSAQAREGNASRRTRSREEERSAREPESHEGRQPEERGQKTSRKGSTARQETPRPDQTADSDTAAAGNDRAVQTGEGSAADADDARRTAPEDASRSGRARSGGRAAGKEAARERRRSAADDDMDEADESLPRRALEELDQTRLRELAGQCVSRLIQPLLSRPAGEPEVDIVDGRVRVAVDCGEDSGLLIGREGQTLAALQYLASRIVSRGMDSAVRVQLDAGRYRQRQEEKLRDMALALAAKVRQTGRSYSTRPLSSYHRRIIHLCLQDMDDVLTRSTGDGPLKRVVILRRRPEKGERLPQERDARRRSQPDGSAADGCVGAALAAPQVCEVPEARREEAAPVTAADRGDAGNAPAAALSAEAVPAAASSAAEPVDPKTAPATGSDADQDRA